MGRRHHGQRGAKQKRRVQHHQRQPDVRVRQDNGADAERRHTVSRELDRLPDLELVHRIQHGGEGNGHHPRRQQRSHGAFVERGDLAEREENEQARGQRQRDKGAQTFADTDGPIASVGVDQLGDGVLANSEIRGGGDHQNRGCHRPDQEVVDREMAQHQPVHE